MGIDTSNLYPANTYGDILQISHTNLGLDGTLRAIQDGLGNDSPLMLSTSQVAITGLSGVMKATAGIISASSLTVSDFASPNISQWTNDAGYLTSSTGVTSITGTANQVLANGTSGSAQTGAVILTLPQNIDTAAAVQFGSVTFGSTISPAVTAKITVVGGNSSVSTGPNQAYFTTADIYPLLQILPFTHNNVTINFDSYFGAVWRSSSVNSNFQIEKSTSSLSLKYAAGIAVNSAISWISGLSLTNTGIVNVHTNIASISTTTGSLVVAGGIGVAGNITANTINIVQANTALNFGSTLGSRKIELYRQLNNDNQFWGFGIDSNVLRYQLGTTGGSHIFYAGVNSTTSNVLFTINGSTGNVVATGTVIGSNLSGTNTGDVTLTGENYLSIASQLITVSPVNLGSTNVTGILVGTNGGTGVNNGTNTITIGGNVTFSGAFATTFTITGTTSVTFPTSGTLATTAGTVASITGTADQVLANGTSGSAQTGAVTLTLPQSIATSSNVQFAKVGIGASPASTAFLTVQGASNTTRGQILVQSEHLGGGEYASIMLDAGGFAQYQIRTVESGSNIEFADSSGLSFHRWIQQQYYPNTAVNNPDHYITAVATGICIDTLVGGSTFHVYENTSGTGLATGITIEQDSTGDATLRCLLTGGVVVSQGIDNSDSDKFKLGYSSDLGTNPVFTIGTNGATAGWWGYNTNSLLYPWNINLSASNSIAALFFGDIAGSNSGFNIGVYFAPQMAPTSTTTALSLTTSILPNVSIASGKTITLQSALYISAGSKTGTGTITNSYGIYVEQSSYATNNYSAYFADTVLVGVTASSSSLNQVEISRNSSNTLKIWNTASSDGRSTIIASGEALNGRALIEASSSHTGFGLAGYSGDGAAIFRLTGANQAANPIVTQFNLFPSSGILGLETINNGSGGAVYGVQLWDLVNGRAGINLNTTAPVSTFHIKESTSTTSTANGLTIEQASSGDASLHFLLSGGVIVSAGIDNSDSDNFKLGYSSDLGTSPVITMGTNGASAGFLGYNTNTLSFPLNVNLACTTAIGAYFFGSIAGSDAAGDVGIYVGCELAPTAATTTLATHVTVTQNVTIASGKTITNQVGLYIGGGTKTGTGTITNAYGLYIEDSTFGGTRNYSAFFAGAVYSNKTLTCSGTNSGGSGDYTNISNPQMLITANSSYPRVVHTSSDSTIQMVYNYQTGKDIYWGESADTGNYYFRGRELSAVDGNILISKAGKTIKIKEGTNACKGTATLVAGTVTVNTTAVATGDMISMAVSAVGGTQGILSYTIVNATSFTINSSVITDTSTIKWWIVKAG